MKIQKSAKSALWLFISDSRDSRYFSIIPALSWMLSRRGIRLECYLEAECDGKLFAQHGSTIIGGSHFQQFNYLCALFDLTIATVGETHVFDSSIAAMRLPVVHATSTDELYQKVLAALDLKPPSDVVVVPVRGAGIDPLPYLYPEILFREALAYSSEEWHGSVRRGVSVYELAGPEGRRIEGARLIDTVAPTDTYADLTTRIADRWISSSRGVAFGDPDAIGTQLAALCRDKYVAVYGEAAPLAPAEISVDAYAE